MSLAGCTQYYYLISCTLTLSPFLSCFSDILMLDWDICCGVLHSSLLVAWLCYRCAGNYWRNPRCQSCHLWQPTHAAFRSLCTNQRTSAGQSRAIVELFSCSQLPQTPQDLMFFPLCMPFPLSCFSSHSNHLFSSWSLQPGLGLETNVFRLCQLPLWTVNSDPLPLPSLPTPLVPPPPAGGNPSVAVAFPSLSRTFCFGLWRKSVAQFSLRVCCSCFRKVSFIFFVLLLLLLLARFIAFYSSLSVRRCFCGNEDVEAAVKRCQRGVVRHRGEGGRRGQSGNTICRHVEGLQNCLQLQIFHCGGEWKA